MTRRQSAPRWEDQPQPRPAGASRGAGRDQPGTASGAGRDQPGTASGAGVFTLDLDIARFAESRGADDAGAVSALIAEVEQIVDEPQGLAVHDLSDLDPCVSGRITGADAAAVSVTIGPERAQPVVEALPGGGAGIRIARTRSVALAWTNAEVAERVRAAVDRLVPSASDVEPSR